MSITLAILSLRNRRDRRALRMPRAHFLPSSSPLPLRGSAPNRRRRLNFRHSPLFISSIDVERSVKPCGVIDAGIAGTVALVPFAAVVVTLGTNIVEIHGGVAARRADAVNNRVRFGIAHGLLLCSVS